MVVSFSHSISFLLLPLLLSLAALFINPASADQNLIDSICQKTQNPNLCHEVFKGSADADRATLVQTAVKLALDSANSTSKLINSLLKSATNPSQKDEYKMCLEVYDDAADNLNQCKTLLAGKQFEEANVKASAALTDADTCVDEAEDVPNNLKEANKTFEDYVSIVLNVINVYN